MVKMIGVLIGLAMFTVTLVLSAVLKGYTLSILWGWFVIPTFGGPKLQVVPAIGMALIVSYLTHQLHSHKDDKEKGFLANMWELICVPILKPLLALFIGWVIHQFM